MSPSHSIFKSRLFCLFSPAPLLSSFKSTLVGSPWTACTSLNSNMIAIHCLDFSSFADSRLLVFSAHSSSSSLPPPPSHLSFHSSTDLRRWNFLLAHCHLFRLFLIASHDKTLPPIPPSTPTRLNISWTERGPLSQSSSSSSRMFPKFPAKGCSLPPK